MLASCPSRDQLTAYFCGKLPEEPSAEIAEHLSACAKCKEVAAVVENLPDALADRLRRLKSHKPLPSDPNLSQLLAKVQAKAATSVVAPAKEDIAEPPPPQKVGNYQILERLGKGGMGIVYKARHIQLGRPAAVKFMIAKRLSNAEDRARFKREGIALARLKHPNVAMIYDAGESDGLPYFIMEFIDGRTLGKLLKQVGKLPVPDACELMYQAAQGLQHAHEAGIIHRDIKPDNLILDMTGILKILDMGLARSEDMPSGTSSGRIMGTPDYMAPEQCKPSEPVDFRADIYALGCTFYHLLAGRPPFMEKEYLDKLNAQCKKTSEPISQVPKEVNAMIQKMLAKNPRERHASAREFAGDLEFFRQGAVLARLLKAPPEAPNQAESTSTIRQLNQSTMSQTSELKKSWYIVVIFAIMVALIGVGLYSAFGPSDSLVDANNAAEQAKKRDIADLDGETAPGEIADMSGFGRAPAWIRMSPTRRYALTSEHAAGALGPVRLWDLNKRKLAKESPRAGGELTSGWAATFSPDERMIAIRFNGGVFFCDPKTGKKIGQISFDENLLNYAVDPLLFSASGQRLLTNSGREGYTRVWLVSGGKKLAEFKHGQHVYSASFTIDDNFVLTAGDDNAVRLWDIENDRQAKSYNGHQKAPSLVRALGDGKRFISLSSDGKAIVWDIKTGDKLREFMIPDLQRSREMSDGQQVTAAASKGNRLLTAHTDGSIKYWDLDKGEKAGQLEGHKGGVWSIDISSDGRFAVSVGAEDSRVRYWRLTNPPYVPGGSLLDPLEKKK